MRPSLTIHFKLQHPFRINYQPSMLCFSFFSLTFITIWHTTYFTLLDILSVSSHVCKFYKVRNVYLSKSGCGPIPKIMCVRSRIGTKYILNEWIPSTLIYFIFNNMKYLLNDGRSNKYSMPSSSKASHLLPRPLQIRRLRPEADSYSLFLTLGALYERVYMDPLQSQNHFVIPPPSSVVPDDH